jgi:hypothetical protein
MAQPYYHGFRYEKDPGRRVSEDITILKDLRTLAPGSKPNNRLYYYQGNFFLPISLHGGDYGRVKKAIRIFVKDNNELITKDRAHPDYKTRLDLFDEQMKQSETL